MAFFGVVINISINMILIPRYQALGSAIASVITQLVTALIQVIIAYKIFKLKINYRFLILLLIFVVGVVLIGVISKDLPYNWIISMVIMVFFSTILAFSIGLIKIKSIYEIIKYDK